MLLWDDDDEDIIADDEDVDDDEDDEDEADLIGGCCNNRGAAMLLLWSSKRVRCDFIIRLKKSSFGIVLPNLPTKLASSLMYLLLFVSLKSSFLISDFDLIEQRWSSKRFDWMRDKTSKNDNSLFSSLPPIDVVFVRDEVVLRILVDGWLLCVNLFSALSMFVNEKFKFLRWKFMPSFCIVFVMLPFALMPLLTRNGCGCGGCCDEIMFCWVDGCWMRPAVEAGTVFV